MDFNGDGTLDVVGGQFGGFVYLALGNGKGEYHPLAKLKDKSGGDVHQGEFWDKAKSAWGKDKNTFQDLGLYHLAVDWDADGDLDLLSGGYSGKLGLRVNEGTRKEPKYATAHVPVKAGGQTLSVQAGLSPAFVDWDGDGKKDLICANSKGTIRFFKNVGVKEAPAFRAGRVLLKTGLSYMKVAVGDLNGDGKLDLVYGGGDHPKKHVVWVAYRKKDALK